MCARCMRSCSTTRSARRVGVRCMRVVCALYALYAILFGHQISTESRGTLYAPCMRCVRLGFCHQGAVAVPCMRLGFYIYVVCVVCAWDFICTLYALYTLGILYGRCMRCMRVGFLSAGSGGVALYVPCRRYFVFGICIVCALSLIHI